MGFYINPPDMTKEQFLVQHGERISGEAARILASNEQSDNMAVCLMNNGGFTAAGIAYCLQEYNAMSHPEDNRSKAWYSVPARDLAPYYRR